MGFRRAFRPLLIALAVTLPALASASWNAPFNGAEEPSTQRDVNDGFMFLDAPPPGASRVYFSGNLVPLTTNANVQRFVAYLGVWADCNRDGFVGLLAANAETYSALLLTDTSVCPPGGPHNDGSTVTELRWIGPGSPHVDDPDARVWVDWGFPEDAGPAGPAKAWVDEELQFDPSAAGPRWVGVNPWLSSSYGNGFGPATFYASLGGATLSFAQTPGWSGAYGAAQCFGPPSNWDCYGPWKGPPPGTIYHVRDVDCFEPQADAQPCPRIDG